MTWLAEHWLDIATTVLGLLYIWLEYRADILLWVVGIIMPALDIILFWQHGLYGDSALAVYYLLAALYGYIAWHLASKSGTGTAVPSQQITRMPAKLYFPAAVFFAASWVATWFLLVNFTNSSVPVLDGFTNALSFVGLWALSRKYVEQWLFWIVVDAVSCYLYIVKGIPFKAGLYGLYVIIAVAGYYKWKRLSVRG